MQSSHPGPGRNPGRTSPGYNLGLFVFPFLSNAVNPKFQNFQLQANTSRYFHHGGLGCDALQNCLGGLPGDRGGSLSKFSPPFGAQPKYLAYFKSR